tara:strand:- start:1065 stop:2312 length:1248 start_codon:yes stop_codon:yes gene_type:complete
MLSLYKILSILLFPFIELWLFYRVYKGKEDKKRLNERFGNTSIKRPDGNLYWVHAVSVGEANSALILIDQILKTDKSCSIILTTTTTSSNQIISQEIKKYDNKVIHQFLPIDSLYCVRSFLNYWKFSKIFFIESEIWPNIIYESKKLGCQLNLINARISPKSYKFWLIAKKLFFINIFSNFDKIIVQDKNDIAKFKNLTKSEVLFFGNLKSQSKPLLYDDKELSKISKQINNRPILLCSSTHDKEEEILLDCYNELQKQFSDLLLIIIPRHINRSKNIAKIFDKYNVAIRSANDKITNKTQIYLVDTMNELGIFYKLCNFTFIGGSIENIGGHNPYEAIKLDCAVISGEKFFNFKEIYQNLEKNNGCLIAKSQKDLIKNLTKLLENNKLSKELIKNSKSIINKNKFIDKLVDILN